MQAALRDDGSIDLADLKRTKSTIYLSLPAMRMGTCSRWLRLFVNLALAQMELVQNSPEHSVLFCLDEFAVLGHMKTIEDAAGQLAGLGVKLWPILQDLTQLKALYGDRWETFLGNAGIVQFFGNSDLTTLEWISKRMGETTIVNKSKSDPGYLARTTQGTKGESYSEAVHPLMTAEEVSRFFGRDDPLLRQLIIRPSHPPLVLQRAYYDKHTHFKGLLDL
jgi:type IV secretion system protein VirD4